MIRLRGAGRAFCAGYDIGWGAQMMEEAEAGRPWDPMADLRVMSRFVDLYMALWRSPEARDHPGPRLLRRRRDRLRAVLGPHRLRRGLPDRLPAGAGLGLADDGDVDVPRRARALQAAAASPATRSTAGARSSGGSPASASPRPTSTPRRFALARRVALLPANQLHMMKVLVNQAFEQMGLHTTQLIGTLLDGASRHTPEGDGVQRGRDGRRAQGGARARHALRRLRRGSAVRVSGVVGAVLAGGAGTRLGGAKPGDAAGGTPAAVVPARRAAGGAGAGGGRRQGRHGAAAGRGRRARLARAGRAAPSAGGRGRGAAPRRGPRRGRARLRPAVRDRGPRARAGRRGRRRRARGRRDVTPERGLQPLCARYEPEALAALATFDPAGARSRRCRRCSPPPSSVPDARAAQRQQPPTTSPPPKPPSRIGLSGSR